MKRREFLGQTMAWALLPRAGNAGSAARERGVARRELRAATLTPFVDPLPLPARAQPVGRRAAPDDAQRLLAAYHVEMRPLRARLHRDLGPATMWGFDGAVPGPLFDVEAGEPIWVNWASGLPMRHFLPIDHHLAGAGRQLPDVRTVVHLHGGKTPPGSDGYPEDWFTPGQSAWCCYPLQQEATALWYHDHAMGIHRLNIYAGLSGFFLLRDAVERELKLPSGEFELPLMLCDRMVYADGQLNYPVGPEPGHPWRPEFFGDAMVVNGKITPYCEVEARRYRLRIVNAANGRFFDLALSNGQEFRQIGTDQGLLPAPVAVRRLTLGPAERADVVVDFSGQGGAEIELRSEEFRLMQFRVKRGAARDESQVPARLRPVPRLTVSEAVRTRRLSLNQYNAPSGRPSLMLLNATRWSSPVTETPRLESVEIWELVNLTSDSHPIHLHLVRFQILDRRPFDTFTYESSGKLLFTGELVAPEANELGWKDTVRAEPGMVTRIIIRFEGFTGRYLWHCHILEHSDNEMMRPYEVLAARGE